MTIDARYRVSYPYTSVAFAWFVSEVDARNFVRMIEADEEAVFEYVITEVGS